MSLTTREIEDTDSAVVEDVIGDPDRATSCSTPLSGTFVYLSQDCSWERSSLWDELFQMRIVASGIYREKHKPC